MAGQSPNKRTFARNIYWNGVFTGVFMGIFLISAIIMTFIRVQGLRVAINPGQLASLIQQRVQLQAGLDMPQMIEGLKQELPGRIAGNLDSLADLTISFGKSEVKVPPEVLESIRMEFGRILEEGILNTLNDYDIKKYQDRLGKNAYESVMKMLKQEIIGKTFLVKTSRWFTVPVRIVGATNNSLRIGI